MIERRAVRDGRDDVEAVVAQQPGQAVAQQREVLGDHNAQGITALIVVGPPAGLTTTSRPSSASTRRASPRRPLPSASAPPAPSSATCTTSAVVDVPHVDLDVSGLRVLPGVRERFGGDEVRRRLDRRRRPARQVDRDGDLQRRALGERGRSRARARDRRAPADGCRARGCAAPRAPRACRAAPRRGAPAPRRDRRRASARPCRGSCRARRAAPARRRAGRARSARSSDSCWSTAPARVSSSTAIRSCAPRRGRATTACRSRVTARARIGQSGQK